MVPLLQTAYFSHAANTASIVVIRGASGGPAGANVGSGWAWRELESGAGCRGSARTKRAPKTKPNVIQDGTCEGFSLVGSGVSSSICSFRGDLGADQSGDSHRNRVGVGKGEDNVRGACFLQESQAFLVKPHQGLVPGPMVYRRPTSSPVPPLFPW